MPALQPALHSCAPCGSSAEATSMCRVAGKIARKKDQLAKLELSQKVKEDLKTVALGTSKINYLDPRITVAWCKRLEVGVWGWSECRQ